MQKSKLRTLYKQKRQQLSDNEVALLSQEIVNQLIGSFDWASFQSVHCFLPIAAKKEVDLWLFIRWTFSEMEHLSLFVPKMHGDTLTNHRLTPNTPLERNAWGILEPKDDEISPQNVCFDAVITPLLYCDDKGNRIGYGKGFYDRFFSEINPTTLKIGVNFFAPNEPIDDVFTSDIPLNYLVTPSGVIEFGR
ncbi:MAG: 5-formyltetrahydrofolate cyclo-ligase [Capnocytophaga sp.]|nr:5-formyltetrahydrofolate cyclo-ligase [Capnocytophaga sp.]